MPTYEYRCTKCGHEFEALQTMSEPPVAFCPECKGKPERLITGGVGFLLKGTGFYQTDYRSATYKADAAKDSGESKKPDKSEKSGTKKEAKTESTKKKK